MNSSSNENRLQALETLCETHAKQLSLILRRNAQHDEWMSTLDYRMTIMEKTYQENLKQMAVLQSNSYIAVESIREFSSVIENRLNLMHMGIRSSGEKFDTLINLFKQKFSFNEPE